MNKIFGVLPIVLLLTAQVFAAKAASTDVLSELAKSNQITPVLEEKFENYSQTQPLSSIWVTNQAAISPANISAENGTSLALSVGPSATELYTNLTQTLTGKVVFKCSYYYSENNIHRKLMLTSLDGDYKNENYFLWANKNGKLERQPGNVFLSDYTPNTWYEIVAVIDTVAKKYDLYINGVKAVSDQATPNTVFNGLKRVYFIKQWDEGAGTHTTYLDNIGVYTLKPYPTASFDKAVAKGVEYRNGANIPFETDDVYVKFSKPVKADSIAGKIRITQDNRPLDFAGTLSQDGTTYILALKEVLKPDREYKIMFAQGISDTENIALQTEQLAVKTAPNVISRIELSSGGQAVRSGDTVTASANAVYLSNAPTNEVLLMIALFKDGKFIDVAYFKEVITQDKQISVSLKVPSEAGNYSVKAFAWDNAADMNAYTD